jgi:uncharacterized protein
MRRIAAVLFVLALACAAMPQSSHPEQAPAKFHVLAFYTEKTEADHVDFARQAIQFFAADGRRAGYDWQATTDWNNLNDQNLSHYQLVVWLNDSAHEPAQRQAFERYMKQGGAWLGFHFAGYNDESTHWPWFTEDFLSAVFLTNSWPPLPAELVVEDPNHPVTRGLPATFQSPANEWYMWQPDPRANKNIHVLLSLSSANYPLGMKDTLTAGDLPVVWTNTRYRMLYCNMGHGDKIFTSAVQNQLFRNAIQWLGETAKQPSR